MRIRPAAVAGTFYPAEADELRALIGACLAEARPDVRNPKALIVPHAGHIYSGPTAAWAYATLDRQRIRRVVLLGPAHRVAFYGLALPSVDAFATPLGTIALDRDAMRHALSLPDVIEHDGAHALEHSLEVQLPFLQTVLDDFMLVPFCVGAADIVSVANVINSLWDGEDTLMLISSDLSHFHPYAEARTIDQQTIADILAMHADLSHEQACGATPINGLLLAAASHGLKPHLLDYRNSGDTAGDRFRVVGYTAIAFTEEHAHE